MIMMLIIIVLIVLNYENEGAYMFNGYDGFTHPLWERGQNKTHLGRKEAAQLSQSIFEMTSNCQTKTWYAGREGCVFVLTRKKKRV